MNRSLVIFLIAFTCLHLFNVKTTYGQSHHSHSHSSDEKHTHLPVDYSLRSDTVQYDPPEPDEEGYRWWKGNLHTHTLWSDGDQFPEVATQWYYEHGYHFLALSDHNTLQRGERWVKPGGDNFVAGGMEVYELYRKRFGDDWIETKEVDGELAVRLKPLQEIQALFEEAGRFQMINSEEITENNHTIHINVTNILDFIEPKVDETVEETIRMNFDAVMEQRKKTGREMIPHLNHPNFARAITAEDMAPVENMRLFEVYNGHRGVLNYGDDKGTKDLDRLWDIILTKRLGELNLDPVYGIAVDDAHNYENSPSEGARPGRGWVKIRAQYLTPERLVQALEEGNFYASNGVSIQKVYSNGNRYSIEIEPEDDVEYTIRFIGTRAGYESSSEPYTNEEGEVQEDRTRLYSGDIGTVLHETTGNEATYEFQGDELYVRAKIISSKPKENYFMEGEYEMAWLQPIQPGQEYGIENE